MYNELYIFLYYSTFYIAATNDTQTFLVAYTYPQLSSKECKTSGGIGVITAENAHDIATKNFGIGSMVNGIVLKIINQAKKVLMIGKILIKEKLIIFILVLKKVWFDYLKDTKYLFN